MMGIVNSMNYFILILALYSKKRLNLGRVEYLCLNIYLMLLVLPCGKKAQWT